MRPQAALVAAGGRALGVVAVARANGELAAAARWNEVHLHAAEAGVAGRIRRVVGERVLVADIVRDLRADGLGVRERFGEKGQAAGGFGELDQGCAGAL